MDACTSLSDTSSSPDLLQWIGETVYYVKVCTLHRSVLKRAHLYVFPKM